jgi:hypothetical protein
VGNWLSGHHGRRSSRPYFDELPRVTAADIDLGNAPAGALVLYIRQGVTVRLVRVSVGCCIGMLRLVCGKCGRACRALYIANGVACCWECTPARYRSHSEAPGRRAVRRAEKVLYAAKVDISRPAGKPKWMR